MTLSEDKTNVNYQGKCIYIITCFGFVANSLIHICKFEKKQSTNGLFTEEERRNIPEELSNSYV